ncbi:unnamed protein product (macronuclear) [Paramecium tetraurelia]|uniref:Uncharacterized protein n=1 Tax=Paramecium tetraurelia TaxID=5888 RepID=A0BKM6_PARTE|nr:uncharacterized protein GSPATT00029724001 [Paramecium tetraurelia]CAK59093.1 unnamed protein product [Paramecium tetraurelia]|eukprot:XP_001426491.1 hypothetical protein (macronuclear) [Paramecium tetraurelia strain d4-2]
MFSMLNSIYLIFHKYELNFLELLESKDFQYFQLNNVFTNILQIRIPKLGVPRARDSWELCQLLAAGLSGHSTQIFTTQYTLISSPLPKVSKEEYKKSETLIYHYLKITITKYFLAF